MKRILFTGGGTGGHIYPLVAVAEELRTLSRAKGIDVSMHYIGVPGDFAAPLNTCGIAVSKIIGSKWRSYSWLHNLVDVPKFAVSLIQTLIKVFWLMPDVLFSKGGPGALAVVYACRFYRIPVFVHESDTVPGTTNRLSARVAEKVYCAFPSAATQFPRVRQIEIVGNPIRRSLLEERRDAPSAKRALGFTPDRSLTLVMGSSQGATRINDFILDILPQLLALTQVLHQTGLDNAKQVLAELKIIESKLPQEFRDTYRTVGFLSEDYACALRAADLVVCRASANIFELAALEKPAILIPLPEAAHDHQTKNAYEYAATGAAIVIEHDNMKPNIFLTQVRQLLGDPERLARMGDAARRFAKPDAAEIIARALLDAV